MKWSTERILTTHVGSLPREQSFKRVEAIGDAMRVEYEAIVNAGLLLQLDCPDLAMARHTGFQDLTEAELRAKPAALASRRLW